MDVFCMAGVHQQPEHCQEIFDWQSNYLAEGQNLNF